MVSSSIHFVSALGFAFKAAAQCVTAGYVPCLAPGASVPVAPATITPYGGSTTYGSFGSGFWSSVSGVASDPIQFGGGRRSIESLDSRSPQDDAYTEIEKRQNSLCCRPAPVECLTADGVPFCYNPATTRLYFSDGSVAYLSNDTFYGSDGTFIDYQNGVYIFPNGTEVDFTPDSSVSSSSVGGSQTVTVVSSAKGTPGVSATKGAGTATAVVGGSAIITGSGSGSTSTSTTSKNEGGNVKPGMLVAVLGMAAALF